MGKPSPEETERNKLIIEDYNSGKYSTVEMVLRYRITSQRIHQIVKRNRQRNEKQS